MPISLPQLSRRGFLKRAALAGTAAALAPDCYAGWLGQSRDPHTFAFFSDAHIAADASLEHGGVNMAQHLAACVRQLVDWPVKPAAIIINGDLAYAGGLPADYATFGPLIHPLRALAPIHLALGNHDGRENFWQAFPHDAARVSSVPDKQAVFLPTRYANWFLLDSLELTAHTPGDLGPQQVEWLARGLAAHPEKPALVVCHHPLDPTGLMGLKDSAALEDLLIRHRQVKAFIFGHTHNWSLAQLACGVHLVNLPQTAYPFVPGRPSGWVRAKLAPDGAEFELRCLDPHHPEHAQVAHLKWRPA